MISLFKSITQKVREKFSLLSGRDSADELIEQPGTQYSDRLKREQAFYKDCLEVHELPDIFHYWSNKYLAPDAAELQ